MRQVERQQGAARTRLEDGNRDVDGDGDDRVLLPSDVDVDSDTHESVIHPSPDNTKKEEESTEKPVTWLSLPRKSQLAILTIARLSEPLTQTSLQAYIFYMLRSFDPSLPDSTISAQAGLLQGSFTAAQFLTAVFWGRLADSEVVGRKRVLMIGLLGTCVSCVGFGFSRGFWGAMVFRVLGGVLNSNVGVMRTMIAEMVVEKKYVFISFFPPCFCVCFRELLLTGFYPCRYQSRAFLILPMCFNVGVIIGPIFGGILADPVKSYPNLLGPGSLLGGKDGVWWMQHWPYALPNVLSAIFIFASAVAVFLGLDEVCSLHLVVYLPILSPVRC